MGNNKGRLSNSLSIVLPSFSSTAASCSNMSTLAAVAALAVAVIPNAFAQFVPAPTDLITTEGYANVSVRYKEVPTGICELDPNVKTYSGYADISEQEHIFFWFFEAREKNASTAPLTVWINGGPGSSSMVGLWEERTSLNHSGTSDND